MLGSALAGVRQGTGSVHCCWKAASSILSRVRTHKLASLKLIFWLFLSALAFACAASNEDTGGDDSATGTCPVGSEACPCTMGGACDPGLECLSNICVDPTPTGGGMGGNGGSVSVGSGAGSPCLEGCSKLDVLFAIDHSDSMTDEVSALGATQAFRAVVDTLSGINCGNIDYRIAVTDDNDRGFMVPPAWQGANPWFDSTELTPDQIATNFQAVTQQGFFMVNPTPEGCEHVLTSAKDLLVGSGTSFLREDALLVLVLVTDVDDFGDYDQYPRTCPLIGTVGCMTPPTPLANIQADLLALKGGDELALATIVIAGDPSVQAGVNFCSQPATCCGSIDCDGAFHATRLWSFASMMAGMNGYVANICGGPQSVPTAVQEAFANNIDLACQTFEPPK